MSRGNVQNSDASDANALTFGLTTVPLGTGILTSGNVLTYDGTRLVLSPTAAGPANPLSAVLAVGNTTGANNVVIDSGQQLTFGVGSGIRIAVNGTAVPAPAAGSVALGNLNTNASGSNSVAVGVNSVATGVSTTSVGNGATATQTGNTAVGASASVTGVNSCAFGLGATCTGAQACILGANSTGGSGNNNTVCGAASFASGTTADSTIVGQGCVAPTGSSFIVQVGNGINTGGAALSNVVAIGTQGAVGGSNSVKVGRGVQGSGGFNTSVGDFVTLTGTASSNVVMGQNITIPTATVGSTFIGTAPTITGTPSDSVAVGYLTNTSVANATVLGSRSQGVGASVTSVGWTTNVGATGGSGVAVGAQANSGTGARNTAVGTSATHSTSTDSTVCGFQATTVGSGASNSIFGAQSSITNASSANCAILGAFSNITGAFTNCTVLGSGATGAASNAVYLRTGLTTVAASTAVNYDTVTGRLFPVTSSIRYKRDVRPLENTSRVLDIEPVTYAFQKGRCGCSDECDGDCSKREVGAIAEQVWEVLPEVVVLSVDPETGMPRPESVQYDRLCIFLIAELKKQQYALVNHAKRLKLIEDYLSTLPDPIPSGVLNQDQTL